MTQTRFLAWDAEDSFDDAKTIFAFSPESAAEIFAEKLWHEEPSFDVIEVKVLEAGVEATGSVRTFVVDVEMEPTFTSMEIKNRTNNLTPTEKP